MRKLWAPWRMEYILGNKPDGCIFCQAMTETDLEGKFILYRQPLGFIIMNLYPYNNGHLLIVPNRHVSNLRELAANEQLALSDMINHGIKALEENLNPAGFNIGLNMGRTAGAGIDDHIHWHVVPRWAGDHNFMPVLAETRVISEYVTATYRKLRPYFERLTL